jgi:hypothetical protein
MQCAERAIDLVRLDRLIDMRDGERTTAAGGIRRPSFVFRPMGTARMVKWNWYYALPSV